MCSDLRLHYMIEPSFGMTDVDDCVSAIVHDGFLLHADAQRSVNDTRASLWRKQFDCAECALCAKSVASRYAAPEHDVDTGEHLPWKISCRRRLDIQSVDELVEEMRMYRVRKSRILPY